MKVRIAFAVVGLVLTSLVATSVPAAADGGATIVVTRDGVWRTKSWQMYDYSIPAACSGPTSQAVKVTADLRATSSGLYIKNVRVQNLTARTLSHAYTTFGSFDYLAEPYNPAWTANVTKTLKLQATLQPVNIYKKWSSGLVIEPMFVPTLSGVLCEAVYTNRFRY